MFAIACHPAIIITITPTKPAQGQSHSRRDSPPRKARAEETARPRSRVTSYFKKKKKKTAQFVAASHTKFLYFIYFAFSSPLQIEFNSSSVSGQSQLCAVIWFDCRVQTHKGMFGHILTAASLFRSDPKRLINSFITNPGAALWTCSNRSH